MNRRTFVALAVTVVTLTIPVRGRAQEQQAPTPQEDISGMYDCQGVGPDGPYQAIVEITKNDDTYRLRWVLGENEELGLAIFKDDTLAVSLVGSNSTGGVMIFRIEQPSGRLVGGWSAIGSDGKVYSETLTKRSGEEVIPSSPSRPSATPRPTTRPLKVA